MQKQKRIPPHLPASLPEANIDLFCEEDFISNCLIQDCVINAPEARNIDIRHVIFKNVVFTGGQMPSGKITDTLFRPLRSFQSEIPAGIYGSRRAEKL